MTNPSPQERGPDQATKQGENKGHRWQPGESGNPNGRPKKGYSISEMMKEMLGNKPDVKESIGSVIVAKAMEGDMQAIKLVWEYMDGKPKQAIVGGGEDDEPIQHSMTIKFVRPEAKHE
jgi:hypothetical protein